MSLCASPSRRCHSVYGVRVLSDMPFEFPVDVPSEDGQALADVEFVVGAAADFDPFSSAGEPDEGVVCRVSPDGLTYLRWPRLYEFVVAADGSRVACRPLDGCDGTVLQNFLFGQVLAVALVRQGIEPLHASVVQVGAAAVGFLGDCTFGKSTLLASFVQAGHRVLTDDMLILARRAGETVALPGAGRIKLNPDSASCFLDRADAGTPLTATTAKCSFPLDSARQQRTALPLQLLFVLPDPDERDRATSIEIRPASRAEMVHELVKNTFTTHVIDQPRLTRQFAHVTQVASDVDGFRLRYPTGLHHLVALRQAIVEHSLQWIAQRTS